MSTFYHYIANVNINDEKTAISMKKRFNEYAELGVSEPAEPRGQVRPLLGSGSGPSPYSESVSLPSLNRRMTRFEDELIPTADGKNDFGVIDFIIFVQLENERRQTVLNSRIRNQIRGGLKIRRPIIEDGRGQTNISFHPPASQAVVEPTTEPVSIDKIRYK